jgi:hypothetical protein
MNKNLKTFVKWLVFIILTVAAAYVGFCLSRAATRTIVYSGTNVKFTADTDYFLLINADSVTFKAASQEFFILHKVTGEAITPTQAPPPFDWQYDTYYFFGSATVSGGKWNVDEGNPTVQITSSTPVTVTEVPTEDRLSNINFSSAVIGFILWLIMLFILLGIDFYSW